MSFHSKECLPEVKLPIDVFAQIIEGKVSMVVDQASLLLQAGEGISNPANRPTIANPISALNDSHK